MKAVAAALALVWTAATDGDVVRGEVVIVPGRTAAVVATWPSTGAVENAVPGRAFALGVAQDRAQRWAEAAPFYAQAVTEWSAEMRAHPSAALDHAIQKAERERQRSVMLANLELQRGRQPESANRSLQLDRARLLRAKLMVVRAADGAIPAALYARTLAELADALRAADAQATATRTELHLLVCATHAAAGDTTAAGLALAHVTDDQRIDPANAVPMAACAAALNDLPGALRYLDSHLHQRIDPFSQRDLYLANDWDPLRGQPRFETLFAALSLPRY